VRIDPTCARIVLLEAGPRVLPSFPPALSERAARDLRELGVEVRTGCRVDDVDADGITVGSERLWASSVFWAAGVRANSLTFDPPVTSDRAGRLTVREDFSLVDRPCAFAVGDVAAFQVEPGTMATIGRNRAVGDLKYVHLAGRVAWIAWLFVHVLQLVGFRNRASVITQWAWNYLFSRRESRLITEPRWQLGEEH